MYCQNLKYLPWSEVSIKYSILYNFIYKPEQEAKVSLD